MKVRDPEGRTWRVTRRWLPWRPRRRGLGPEEPAAPPPTPYDPPREGA